MRVMRHWKDFGHVVSKSVLSLLEPSPAWRWLAAKSVAPRGVLNGYLLGTSCTTYPLS